MLESVPELFGPFRLVRRITRGGMGIVVLAIDTRSNRAVILKRIAADKRGTEGEVRFRDEIKLTAQFGHPSIVHVADFGEIDGEPYMALEHVVGQDLMSIIERGARGVGQMPPPIALKVIDRVLDALGYAHGVEGFVHRDISPGNVMVSYDGEVKIIDLGLAFFDEKRSRTQAGIVAGTAGFIAPERARGQQATARSDLWAVGTLAFSLMTGVPPAFVQPGDPAFAKWIDQKLTDAGKAWLFKAVSANPDERFESAQAMRDALRKAEQLGASDDIAAYIAGAFTVAKADAYEELDRLGVMTRHKAKTQQIPEKTYVGLPSGALPRRVPVFALVAITLAIAGSIAMVTIRLLSPTTTASPDLGPSAGRADLSRGITPADLASPPLVDAAPAAAPADLALAARPSTPIQKHPQPAPPTAAIKAKVDAARAQMRSGQLAVAERMLRELSGPDGEPPPEAELALADIALLRGNYDDAAMKGQSAWRRGKAKRGLYVTAIAYTKKGDLPSARKWLKKFLDVEPTDKAARELLEQIGTGE